MNNIFKITQLSDDTLQQYYNDAITDLRKFFGKEWLNNTPILCVVDDRKTIDSLKGQETPRWIVGWGWSTHAIFILNPKNFVNESSYNYTSEDIKKLIKHELCHTFYSLITQKNGPRWFTEGLALNVAEQLTNYKKPTQFKGFLNGENLYQESAYAVKLLFDNFGKEKVLEFTNSLRGVYDSAVSNKFAEVFGFELNYISFNSLLANSK